MKKIVVLTSGGDAPGMNAAIRAVVRAGCSLGLEVYGSLAGYQGLVTENLVRMEPESVANCIQHGGTILKTDRCFAFHERKVRNQCRAFLRSRQVDGVIVIGGNGTFQGALLLSREDGPPVIGIPGTIDNDIPGTDYTIGYDTARNTALQAIDKIRDTASSHDRNFLVEVMGHRSGFLAVDVGIAGGAEVIVIPEFELSISAIAAKIAESRHRRSKQSSIIIVAEGSQPGRSVQIAEALGRTTEDIWRVCILGHTQRGGSPTTQDRLTASRMGFLAVKALMEGQTECMTAIQAGELLLMPFPGENNPTRRVNNRELIELNDILRI